MSERKNTILNEIKKQVESLGYIPLFDNYKNAKTKLTYATQEGYKLFSTLNNLKNGYGNTIFSLDNPYRFDNVKLWLKLNNYDLVLCDDNIWNTSRDKLKFIDKNGYIIYSPWIKVMYNTYYNPFHVSNPYTVYNIKVWLKNNKPNYELISTEYLGYTQNLKFRCNIHGEFEIDLSHLFILEENRGCQKCGTERKSGKNSYNYNPNLTDKERVLKRKILGEDIQRWSKEVLKRDNYACQYCGVKGVYLQAHHKDGYNWYIEGRVDISNGVTLCKECHKMFHKQFGYGDNTKEQFEIFIEEKLESMMA